MTKRYKAERFLCGFCGNGHLTAEHDPGDPAVGLPAGYAVWCPECGEQEDDPTRFDLDELRDMADDEL